MLYLTSFIVPCYISLNRASQVLTFFVSWIYMCVCVYVDIYKMHIYIYGVLFFVSAFL